jgi:hypothetical protein
LALQGTLDTFSLPDVLRLLATTAKTGRLRIEGDRGQGNVWLRGGAVVDADADRAVDGAPTEEVIFELLRFDSGSFAFESDARTPNAEDPGDVEDLLRRANALLSEWTELEAVVPSLEHRVSLSPELSADEVTIDGDRWRSVVAVASGRSVRELASSLGLSELHVSRAVRDLVELGVADVGGPDGKSEPGRLRAGLPDLGRHRPAPPLTPGPDRGPVSRPDPAITGESPAVGWRQPDLGSGPQPAVSSDSIASASAATDGPTRAAAGRSRSRSGPVDAAPANPSRRARSSRLGRARAASTPADDAAMIPPPAPARGVPPPPDRRTTDTGRTAQLRNGSSGAPGTRRDGASGPLPRVPGGIGGGPSPFDGGRLGPPPAPTDTGQIPAVSSSALPPDLHWAADDDPSGPTTGPVASPFSGLTSLAPSRPGSADGEVAPHVAAMSPEARAAVESTVGGTGGAAAGPPAGAGEDMAQRGRLINFLSSVR